MIWHCTKKNWSTSKVIEMCQSDDLKWNYWDNQNTTNKQTSKVIEMCQNDDLKWKYWENQNTASEQVSIKVHIKRETESKCIH